MQVFDRLAAVVSNRVSNARRARNSATVLGARVETWFQRCELMLNKRHERDAQAAFPDMVGYFGFGMLKVNATTAKLKTTYSTALGLPFKMEASARPELNAAETETVKNRVARNLADYLAARGLSLDDVPAPAPDYVTKWLRKNTEGVRVQLTEAARTAAAEDISYQADVMRDQYQKGGWPAAANALFHDLVSKPYAVAAYDYASTRDYRWDGNKVAARLSMLPQFRRVRPEDFIFGSDSSSAQDGEGCTEERWRSRSELLAIAGTPDAMRAGYSPEAIMRLLTTYEKGDLNWSQAANFRMIGNVTSNCWSQTPANRILTYVHQGVFSAAELAELGLVAPAPLSNATLEVTGGYVIRAQLTAHPLGGRSYYAATYNGPGPYGASPLMILRDRQMEINWLMYAKNRNAWHVSGPSVVFNSSYFDAPEDVKLSPFSQHWASPKNNSQHNWGVQQVNVNPIFGSLHEEVRRTMILGDEESGVPSLFSGLTRGGAGATTLGGAILTKTQGEMGVDSAVINLDIGIIQPMGLALHFDNLQYLSDKRYKRGDVELIGRGLAGLRDREQEARLRAGALPLAVQLNAQGIVPNETLIGALRDYFADSGIDAGKLGPSTASANELASVAPTPVDGRTAPPQALGLTSGPQ